MELFILFIEFSMIKDRAQPEIQVEGRAANLLALIEYVNF